MATGWLAWTMLLLAGATGSDDVVHMNQRGFQIPIKIQPERINDVRELYLYVSPDRGKTWEIYSKALPTAKAFDFFSAADGLLYFSIAVIDQRGKQDPLDVYKAPIGLKVHVDTVKPVLRLSRATRVGDEVEVAWEISEERPEWTSLKLEWKPTEATSSPWTPLPAQPGERGTWRFRPNVAGDLTLRLSLRDQGGNEAIEEMAVAGGTMLQDRNVARASETAPMPPIGGNTPPPPVAPTPNPTTTTSAASPPLPRVANEPPPSPIGSSTGVTPTAAMPTRSALPQLQIVNKKQMKLAFDVTRVGPSGLGAVDVYVTEDEGGTWEKAVSGPGENLPVSPETNSAGPLRGTVTVQIPKEGKPIGYYLVVKSRAGLGKPAPVPGESPHVRLECDTVLPNAELYAPQPDAGRGPSVVLTWKAEDRNLAQNPISLEWSGDGKTWEFIGDAQLPNTGRYAWPIPAKIPPKVHLRLTVRDTAGNVAIAQTGEPVLIDVMMPELGGVTVMPVR